MIWRLFMVFCLFIGTANSCFSQTSQQCLLWMLWKEARGEGVLTQRAVYDVAMNRSKASGKDICYILRAEGQFPYSIDGVGTVPKYFLTRVRFVANMEPVVSTTTYHFNDIPHRWAKNPKKIGHLFFY